MEKQESNFVYIMRLLCQRKRQGRFTHKNIFKIGVTNDPARRLHNLETDGCPFVELELVFWVRFNNEIKAKEAEKLMHFKYQENNIKREWFWFQTTKILPSHIKRHLLHLPCAIEMSEYLPRYTETKGNRYFIKEYIRTHTFHKQKSKAKCAICGKEFTKGSWIAKYCSKHQKEAKCRNLDSYKRRLERDKQNI